MAGLAQARAPAGRPALATQATPKRRAGHRISRVLLGGLTGSLAGLVAALTQPVASDSRPLMLWRAAHHAQQLLSATVVGEHARDRYELLDRARKPCEAQLAGVAQGRAGLDRGSASGDRTQPIAEDRVFRRRAKQLLTRVIARLDQPQIGRAHV